MTDRLDPVEPEQPSPAWTGQSLRGQFLRFVAVGIVGTAVHYGVMLSLIALAGVSPVVGTCAGFFLSLGASYALNRIWTFDKRPPWARGFLTYFLVCAVGLGINMGIVAIAIDAGFHYMLGQIVATFVALFWNFLSARFIVVR